MYSMLVTPLLLDDEEEDKDAVELIKGVGESELSVWLADVGAIFNGDTVGSELSFVVFVVILLKFSIELWNELAAGSAVDCSM